MFRTSKRWMTAEALTRKSHQREYTRPSLKWLHHSSDLLKFIEVKYAWIRILRLRASLRTSYRCCQSPWYDPNWPMKCELTTSIRERTRLPLAATLCASESSTDLIASHANTLSWFHDCKSFALSDNFNLERCQLRTSWMHAFISSYRRIRLNWRYHFYTKKVI